MTSDQDDEFDLDALKAQARAETPRPDPALRAAHLRLAAENFAKLQAAHQGSADGARHRLASPVGGLWQGAKTMWTTLNTPGRALGGLTATTALVACGVLILTPAGQGLWRGTTTLTEADFPLQEIPPSVAPDAAAQQSAPRQSPTSETLDLAVTEAPAPVALESDVSAESMNVADAEVMAPPPASAPGVAATALPEGAPMLRAAPAPATHTNGLAVGGLRAEAPPVVEPDTEAFASADDNPLKITAQEPVSTFSIDVDTASYAVVRRSLNAGQLPPRDAVRVEEMVNYFPYAYPAPETETVPFRSIVTVMGTPWNADTQLVHIGIQGALPAIADRPALNLVFLIDTSGSMEAADKLPLLKQSFRLLVDQLRPDDQVAIVEYAGSAGLVLPPTDAADRSAILSAIGSLGAGGATNGQGGLDQAYAVARQMAANGEVSRIILATDGDFNVGTSSPDALTKYIADQRDSGTYLSVLGFGRGNLDDAVMQALAQNGNGTAAYIDTLNEAQKVLVDQLTGTLFPIAGDVKVQVEFNPAVVAEYRLIGYETRALNREDFNNDRVDAGDLGAGHSVTAIYEITPVGSPAQLTDPLRYGTPDTVAGASDEVGFLRLRWKTPGADDSQLLETPIPPGAGEAGTEARFAVAIAGFGQLLRGNDAVADWGWDGAIALAAANRGEDAFGYRNEAVQLMRLAQSLSAD